jgi:dolichol-phosphate mannosyltransferase
MDDLPVDLGRVLVIIPTYNERENLPLITERVRSSVPEADLLVVDDGSPDGTGDLADEVMHRTTKSGLGGAYIAGFHWAMEQGYDVMVEMDADGSHQPEQLPDLLAALAKADLVIGARWVPGGEVVNWPKSREFLSRGANIYARIMLGFHLRDSTGGYRAFRRATLEKIGLSEVEARGYGFQVDLAYRTVKAGLTAVEVPITFVERIHGVSKMSRNIVIEAMLLVTRWGLRDRLTRLRRKR